MGSSLCGKTYTPTKQRYTVGGWAFIPSLQGVQKLFPGRKYKLDYTGFVEVVARHFLMSKPTNDPFSTPLKRVRTLPTEKTGPSGEVSVCDLTVFPGGGVRTENREEQER